MQMSSCVKRLSEITKNITLTIFKLESIDFTKNRRATFRKFGRKKTTFNETMKMNLNENGRPKKKKNEELTEVKSSSRFSIGIVKSIQKNRAKNRIVEISRGIRQATNTWVSVGVPTKVGVVKTKRFSPARKNSVDIWTPLRPVSKTVPRTPVKNSVRRRPSVLLRF